MLPGSRLRATWAPAAMGLLVLLWLASMFLLPAPAVGAARSSYSRHEINWALTWINTALPKFMKKGIIAKISTKNDHFQVFAGKPWYELGFTQQGAFLENLSRAREIIGHAPYFTVIDIGSLETLARVSGQDIEILIPGQGFSVYIPQDPYSPLPPGTGP